MEKIKVYYISSVWQDKLLLGRQTKEYATNNLSKLDCRFFDDVKAAEQDFEEGVFNVVLPLACPLVQQDEIAGIVKSMRLRGTKRLDFRASRASIVFGRGEKQAIFVTNPSFFEISDAKSFCLVYNLLRDRIADRLLANGVVIFDKASTFVDDTAKIGADAKILPFCRIEGNSEIESGACVFASFVKDSIVKSGANVEHSHIVDSIVGSNATVGPYARLRGANIGKGCRIGDFVEVKASMIGDGTKSAHLSYIGDAVVGERTNIGCGTVFCNYDGKAKHKTSVGNDCFVGANANLVAPISIGDNCFVGAGTTVSHNLDDNTFALGRAEVKTKPKR